MGSFSFSASTPFKNRMSFDLFVYFIYKLNNLLSIITTSLLCPLLFGSIRFKITMLLFLFILCFDSVLVVNCALKSRTNYAGGQVSTFLPGDINYGLPGNINYALLERHQLCFKLECILPGVNQVNIIQPGVINYAFKLTAYLRGKWGDHLSISSY